MPSLEKGREESSVAIAKQDPNTDTSPPVTEISLVQAGDDESTLGSEGLFVPRRRIKNTKMSPESIGHDSNDQYESWDSLQQRYQVIKDSKGTESRDPPGARKTSSWNDYRPRQRRTKMTIDEANFSIPARKDSPTDDNSDNSWIPGQLRLKMQNGGSISSSSDWVPHAASYEEVNLRSGITNVQEVSSDPSREAIKSLSEESHSDWNPGPRQIDGDLSLNALDLFGQRDKYSASKSGSSQDSADFEEKRPKVSFAHFDSYMEYDVQSQRSTSTRSTIDSKNQKVPRCVLFAVFFIVSLFIAGGVTAYFLIYKPQESPTSSPTSFSRAELYELVVSVYPEGGEALQDDTSPQYAAMEWLLSNERTVSNKDLIQRYALATLYYSTKGSEWNNASDWLSKIHECTWFTTGDSSETCDADKNYIKISLQGNFLTGKIPTEIFVLLTKLESIHLDDNSISGSIPSMIHELSRLEYLDLSSNGLYSILPSQLGQVPTLRRIDLSDNKIFSTIPHELGHLNHLEFIDLGSNQLTGSIPTTVGSMAKLSGLSLYDNYLSGTLPKELSQIQSLQLIYIDGNEMMGSVSSDVCQLDTLRELWADCDRMVCSCCTTCCTSQGCGR